MKISDFIEGNEENFEEELNGSLKDRLHDGAVDVGEEYTAVSIFEGEELHMYEEIFIDIFSIKT